MSNFRTGSVTRGCATVVASDGGAGAGVAAAGGIVFAGGVSATGGRGLILLLGAARNPLLIPMSDKSRGVGGENSPPAC